MNQNTKLINGLCDFRDKVHKMSAYNMVCLDVKTVDTLVDMIIQEKMDKEILLEYLMGKNSLYVH